MTAPARITQPVVSLADAWADVLLDDGYCVIPGAIDPLIVAALDRDLDVRFAQTPLCQGPFYGGNTKRFGSLLKRSGHVADFVQHRLVLDIVERVLQPHCDVFQLNLTQAIELHPGQPAQFPHRDQDMWRGVPGAAEYLVNVMWPLTPFRKENGATVIWPGSHRRLNEPDLRPEEAIFAEMEPGSALLFLGSTLHGGGANQTQSVRRGMIISYCLGWLKPYENQWLAYPPEIARTFSPELAALVGYRQHRPNLGNYEGRCPSVLLQENVGDFLGARDELRPDQIAMLQGGALDAQRREAS